MRGFPPWQVNRVTLQVASALLGQGACVVFGHDWRDDGVMDATYRFAIQFEPPAADGEQSGPLMVNLLPWPDKPRLSDEEQERLGNVLHIEQAGLPDGLEDHVNASLEDEALRRYLRARALTHMRRRLDSAVQARVCLGGRTAGSQGRYPGIIEEALLAVQQRKPLYLAGLLGGATQQVISAIAGERMPTNFCASAKHMQELYAARTVPERSEESRLDRVIDPEQVWSTFKSLGISGLSQLNHLDDEKNEQLFHTPALEQALNLILEGVASACNRKS